MIRLMLSVLLALFLLAGCGGGGSVKPYVVINPYVKQVKIFSLNGRDAMQRERWLSAQNSFEKALDAAHLSVDEQLLATAWYNLGLLHLATADMKQAEAALWQAEKTAQDYGLSLSLIRAQLALALIYARDGRTYQDINVLGRHWPIDVYMSAARLAQLKGQVQLADELYHRTLRQAGDNRAGMKLQADSYMGLALLAYAENDMVGARGYSAWVLKICKKIGAPRLMAHALLLRADLGVSRDEKEKGLLQARAIYRILHDIKGQRDSVRKLMLLAEESKDDVQLKQLQQVLSELDAMVKEPSVRAVSK